VFKILFLFQFLLFFYNQENLLNKSWIFF